MSNHNQRFVTKAGRLYQNIKTNIPYQEHFINWMNRRAFLKASSVLSLLSFLPVSNLVAKNSESSTDKVKKPPSIKQNYFTETQHKVLDAVQMQLFPDDGNGPSARDLNAISYLEFAMTDPKNINDGDPEFIAKGVGWLEDLSKQNEGVSFTKLSNNQQDEILKQIAKSQAGENWLSLLMYYLAEALMLDPVYGGNPNGIGWQWLEHQPGFPRPVAGKTYRDFE